jgi:hypothetical protein
MESLCIYILDISEDLENIISMVKIASTEAFPKQKFDIWLGFNGPNIEEVASFFNYKITRLNYVEARNAFDRIVFLGVDNKAIIELERARDENPNRNYSIDEINEKTSSIKPFLIPYEVASCVGDYDALLDCMNKYKDNEQVIEGIKGLLKEIKIED